MLFLALISFAASANEPASKYEQLQNRFEQTVAMASDSADSFAVKGWYVGRCYKKADPDRAHGVIFLASEKTVPQGNGPLFDRVTRFFLLESAAGAEDPARYDDDAKFPSDWVRGVEENVFESRIGKNVSFDAVTGALRGRFGAEVYWAKEYELPSTGRWYLFVRHAKAVMGRDGAQLEDVQYCYFFKKKIRF